MFGEVPVLGLFFGTLLCEFCVSLGATLTVAAWRGNAQADGRIVGALFCAAAIGCGLVAWRAGA
jgi:hypothetical protein